MSGAASMRTTAWGAAWIERVVLARTFEGTELSRGRGLAARGGVDDFSVEPASVGGVVRGRSSLERRVRLGFRRLTDEQWSTVRAELGRSSRLVAAVLDGALPDAFHERLEALGCGLLPGVRDVSIDCTCGNQAESCVHAAAVCCRLADALDADPLLLVTLRGGDRSTLLAGLVPTGASSARTPSSGDLRPSVIPGRPADPTMSASTAWRRRVEPTPPVNDHRRSPGRPRVGAVPPSAELGFEQAGLDRLVRDAARRAGALLGAVGLDDPAGHTGRGPGAATSGLELDVVTDAVRRSASATLAAPEVAAAVLAGTTGFSPDLLPAVAEAWRQCGAAGVEVLVHPTRLSDDEISLVADAWEVEVKARSTGAVLPGGRQVRRAADGTWVVLVVDESAGWVVAGAGPDLDELAGD